MLSTAQDGAFDSETPPTILKCRRKKHTKLIKIDNSPTSCTNAIISKLKYVKPDPSAPKITRPCTECGKRFWSWKALSGHMSCHPKGQWRGINLPHELRKPERDTTVTESEAEEASVMMEEDYEVRSSCCCWPIATSDSPSVTTACIVSHGLQALGGHRASYKNIKGCYAITKNKGEVEEKCINELVDIGSEWEVKEHSGRDDKIMVMDIGGRGHKCSLCFKIPDAHDISESTDHFLDLNSDIHDPYDHSSPHSNLQNSLQSVEDCIPPQTTPHDS
ncbi:unnamed protein product [Fraxinus pennsylvanica]|uniref:C2H2-type domain-containing protein n=1 Tax=Fraxinus pennsylvanica TaxID=56036 RepID=A0AAD2DW39_9LAMI|nr:unnamed protein product [Fraxinus pennsylvanica]